MHAMSRRSLFAAAGALTAVTATGCAGLAGGGGSGGGSTVRYAFWGNSVRQENYGTGFDQMLEENPGISLKTEFADYNAYRERMTTQMAAKNVADVFWVPSPDVLTYADNGLYRTLDDVASLDLSDFTDEQVDEFRLGGDLNTLPFGLHIPVVRYNSTFAQEDGVTLDGTWTWDDLAEFARTYSRENPNGRRALSYRADHDLSLQNWLRQRGEQLWTEDGGIGFTTESIAEWIEWWEGLRTDGATTSIGEQDGIEPSWQDIGDITLMSFGNANHAIDDAAMFPDYEFTLLHPPVDPGAPEDFRFIYSPRMAMYSGISEDAVDPAGQVLGYCVNSTDLLRTVGLTMGSPINPRVAEEYREFATPLETQMLDLGEADRAATRAPLFESPAGGGEWRVTFRRVTEGIINGDTDIASGAQQIVDEIGQGIERAR